MICLEYMNNHSADKKFVPCVKAADVKPGKPVCASAGGKRLAVFLVDGAYYAIDNACTHAGGSLCDGKITGRVVECPLHGAKFDVATGEVKAAPAIRPVRTYQVRLAGDMLEVEVDDGSGSHKPEAGKHETYWRQLFQFSVVPIVFWLVQFIVQYFWLARGEVGRSLARSFALAGATLIGAALFSSAIFRFYPPWAEHWRIRRYLGVSGAVLVSMHALSVYYFYFQMRVSDAYYSLNPFENPIVFGSFALFIFIVMACTSTDWMVEKLTPKWWKRIHRLVYLAYMASILHFILINPKLLANPPGVLLLLVTFLAVLGEVCWYVKIAMADKFKTVGSFVGLALIVLAAILGYMGYRSKF